MVYHAGITRDRAVDAGFLGFKIRNFVTGIGMRGVPDILPLGFGAVMINTMPVWLGELARQAGVTEAMAGALGSLVLLSAALTCSGLAARWLARPAVYGVPLFLALLALGGDVPQPVLFVAGCGLGLALGAAIGQAVRMIAAQTDPLKPISIALSIGLLVSMGVYLVLPFLEISALWILCALSLALFVARSTSPTTTTGYRVWDLLAGLPLLYVPFFIMMGTYWSFLEIFGRSLDDANHLPVWLLFSLISGAMGSYVSGRTPKALEPRLQALGLIATALTGGASYIAPNVTLLGLTIVANGFFLFLFFPLYLASNGDRAPNAMAAYLLGFAFGGLVGGMLIEAGGYRLLALAILLSGLAGVARQQPRSIS